MTVKSHLGIETHLDSWAREASDWHERYPQLPLEIKVLAVLSEDEKGEYFFYLHRACQVSPAKMRSVISRLIKDGLIVKKKTVKSTKGYYSQKSYQTYKL